MLFLGIDLGTSFVKVSVYDAVSGKCIDQSQFPETEVEIISLQKGWAEQSPEVWWKNVKAAILKLHSGGKYLPKDIAAIGIAYQMHGLVLVDKEKNILRNSIIWCDSRAIEIGDDAFESIGQEFCLSHLLNSPGNFTASKLAWVKKNEPAIFEIIDKILLPGDFIGMMLTGNVTTTIPALSEGIFWDFKNQTLSKELFTYFDFNPSVIPNWQDVFSDHGRLIKEVANDLKLTEGIPVAYKAGDQQNNALSLNVLKPGEVAATGGTSGVMFAVNDQLEYDKKSRVNTFAHVNHNQSQNSLGTLLCINGAGILNKWMKQISGNVSGYNEMNNAASSVNVGSDGLTVFPFGNGAERLLGNKLVGAHVNQIDFNKHTAAHMFRASQEGIAFAFKYGSDILFSKGTYPKVVRACNANLFLSDVFAQTFANILNVPVELYDSDGSVGAAMGAAIGSGFYQSEKEAFFNFNSKKIIEPHPNDNLEEVYLHWKLKLDELIIAK